MAFKIFKVPNALTSVVNLFKYRSTAVEMHQSEKDLKTKYILNKITIGILTGTAIGFYNASRYEKNLDWNDIVFSGLGGLTSVIIHL
jgi:hypothetical protein